MEKTDRQQTEIVKVMAENEKVCALSKRLRYKPETLLRHIELSLPGPLEQNMFLMVALECEKTILPKTFANLLRYYTNGQKLTPADLEDTLYFKL